MLTLLTTTTVLGSTFEQAAFSLFGSVELFGIIIIAAIMLLMGVSRIPPKFMLMVASFITVAFSFLYGGMVFNTLSVIIVLVYGYLVANAFFSTFSKT